MKIALIGYGKMGHAVEETALQRGHTVVCTVDNDAEWTSKEALLRQADMAVEFSTPATAVDNLRRCFALGLPVVSGTTGWDASREAVEKECRAGGHAMLTASNFSIGMNIMFALNERLAELMRGREDYSVSISETHHIHKLDAPSGTAISLQRQIVESGKRKVESVPIASYREGEVPGTHTVVYDSEIDTLTLTHEAHSRKGLALGAVLAAEWLIGKKGCYTMRDVIG
jgi:4-hydroxy-tetrahydrodipicolinate reductase